MRRSPRLMHLTALALTVLLGSAASSATQQAQPPFQISVSWRSDLPPTRVWIEQGADRVEMVRTGNLFTGSAPTDRVRLTRKAVLVADYAGRQVTLPVRYVPEKPQMRLIVDNVELVPCADGRIRALEQRGQTHESQLESYFKARRLALEADCQSIRKRVVRVWFDRSVGLANDNVHIALDQDAANELKSYPDHREYAAATERQVNSRLIQLDYRYQLALADAGDWSEAVAVNADIQARLNGDEQLARDAARLQGVTTRRLDLDRSYLQSRLSAAESSE